tara:strand:- start:4761 stop:6023 length:1263 start_codon:yes stop_codon:yes gene_type:complete
LYNTSKILGGAIDICGDKSLSHRFLMILSLIKAKSTLKNVSKCKDVLSTIDCLVKCNINIVFDKESISINGGDFKNPVQPLDCQNSGSTLRMLLGLLLGQSISASFVGDESLSKRPMERIIDPLQSMGADFISNNGMLPIMMHAKLINPINYKSKTKSAQVKSALIFAGMGLEEYSKISYNKNTRDHTEQIMSDIGFNIHIDENIKIKKTILTNRINITIPGDISSASFIIAAAILIPGSSIIIQNVLYNKGRLAFIDVLVNMGAKITIKNISAQVYGVQSCDIIASYSSDLSAAIIEGGQIIQMIDEIPIFCIVACFAKGKSIIRDAKELRFKESDRLQAIYDNLQSMGSNIELNDNTMIINGQKRLYNTNINHHNDHRIAMAFEIMKLVIGEDMTYDYANIIDISFPDFYKTLDSLIS